MKTMRSPMLSDDDVVVISWRQHPVVLALPTAFVAVTAVAAGLGIAGALSWWLTLAVGLWFAWTAVGWWRDVTIVTNRQILRDSGVLVRKHDALALAHVAAVRSARSLAGQILGYGEVTVELTRQSAAPEVFSYVPDPDQHYFVLKELLAGRARTIV